MKEKGKHPTVAQLAGARPPCKACGSKWTRYSTRRHQWYCQRCGAVTPPIAALKAKGKGGK